MKQIQSVPVYDLVFQLRKLQAVAKEVAYAKNTSDAEYFTLKYLRPALEEVDALLSKGDEQNNKLNC